MHLQPTEAPSQPAQRGAARHLACYTHTPPCEIRHMYMCMCIAWIVRTWAGQLHRALRADSWCGALGQAAESM